jgi:large subunit ribosomal protein L35
MPKMKTHRGAAKRFKKTASGRMKHGRTNRNHILTKKTTKRKRQLRRAGYAASGDAKKLELLLPYL